MVNVVLFYNRVGPNRLHQLVLANQFSGVCHQHTKRVKQFAPQTNLLFAANKPSLSDVEVIFVE